jgi:hypothetical protein
MDGCKWQETKNPLVPFVEVIKSGKVLFNPVSDKESDGYLE